MKKMQLVYIEWEDACHNSRWFDRVDAKDWGKTTEMTIKEVGWLLEENARYIVLVSRTSGDSCGGLQKIPKTWIRKRRNLTKAIK